MVVTAATGNIVGWNLPAADYVVDLTAVVSGAPTGQFGCGLVAGATTHFEGGTVYPDAPGSYAAVGVFSLTADTPVFLSCSVNGVPSTTVTDLSVVIRPVTEIVEPSMA
jgi:hypothetical protein